jgi:hypothetical protein
LKLSVPALRERCERYLHPAMRDSSPQIGPTGLSRVFLLMKAAQENGTAAVQRQRSFFVLPKRVSALGLRFAGLWFGAWFVGGIILELVRELGPH